MEDLITTTNDVTATDSNTSTDSTTSSSDTVSSSPDSNTTSTDTSGEIIDPSVSSDVDPAATTGISNGLNFSVSDGTNSATIALSNTAGGVLVSVSAAEDILGVFFNLLNDDATTLSGLSVTGDDVVSSAFTANSVSKPGSNPGISPSAFDAGVETGNPGAGQGVLTETSFTVSGITLADVTGQAFGVRTQTSRLTGDAIAAIETTTTNEVSDSVDEVADETTDDSSSDSVDEVADNLEISGESTAMFGEPLSFGSSAVFEVLDGDDGGTNNRFEWGVPAEGSFVNVLQFDGTEFDVEADEVFSLGELLYTNGTVNRAFNGEFPFTLKLSFDELSDEPITTTSGTTTTGGEGSDSLGGSDSVDEVTVTSDSTVNEVADASDSEAVSFEFLFDIFNTPNETGDAVLDGDRLRLNSGGVAPVSFEIGGQDFTVQLLGFSSDGGETTRTGFNSPEESTATAELFAKVVTLSDEVTELFESIDEAVVDEFTSNGGVSLGGDADGTGTIAVSILIKSEITLQIHWGNTVSALTAEYESVSDADGDSDGDGKDEIDLNTEDSNVVTATDSDEEITGTIDSDIVASGGGDDEIDCAGGNDIAVALDGDDMVDGGDGLDIVNGNAGTDSVSGGAGDDIARGGAGDDSVDGGAGDDIVTGDRGMDSVSGGSGADTFACMAQLDSETNESLSVDVITDYQLGTDRLAISAEVFSQVVFSIEDYNSDGTLDFVASFATGQVFCAILNVNNQQAVENDIVQASMDDFVSVGEPVFV